MDDFAVLRDEMTIDNSLRDTKIAELETSLNFAYSRIDSQDKKIEKLEKLYNELEDKLKSLGFENMDIKSKIASDHERLIYQEDNGRRNSLRFRNIPEDRRENWEQC